MSVSENFNLIVTILTIEKTDQVFKAIEKEGITKSTIIPGRGKSDKNPKLFFGLTLEPQRDCILTLVPKEQSDKIFNIIMEEGELTKPLHGIVFVIDVEKVGGLDLDFFDNSSK
ncbi:MAG: P-II family nitrogen regulator [Clostridia bacterium]|jgi:nitrogen regulatory protein PII|nr:P-II family nitrogen regulator [Clostridia bacterium]